MLTECVRFKLQTDWQMGGKDGLFLEPLKNSWQNITKPPIVTVQLLPCRPGGDTNNLQRLRDTIA